MEAKIFLSLHYLITIFFGVLCITSAIILIPVYTTGENTVTYQLDIIGIAHVLGSGDVLWASVMFLVGFSILGYIFVYYYLKQVLQRSNEYEEVTLNLDNFVI